MAGVVSWEAGAIEFVETASRQRAASYRERAEHLSVMARAEPNITLRAKLVELAERYEELADSLEPSHAK
jgi:hypothetical protein